MHYGTELACRSIKGMSVSLSLILPFLFLTLSLSALKQGCQLEHTNDIYLFVGFLFANVYIYQNKISGGDRNGCGEM